MFKYVTIEERCSLPITNSDYMNHDDWLAILDDFPSLLTSELQEILNILPKFIDDQNSVQI